MAAQGFKSDQLMLAGEVLVESSGGEQIITSFPSRKLPRDPEQRFAALFKARPLWKATDLNPFLRSMQVITLRLCCIKN